MCNLGASDIDARLEEQLIDGILYAFQEQTNEVCIVYPPLSPLPPLIPPPSLLLPKFFFFSLFLLGRCDVKWFWCCGQFARNEGQALPTTDLWNNPLEAEQ